MTSATETVCDNLNLYGASFGPDEIDNRPMPERAEIDTAIACLFDPILGLFDGCPLA